MLPISGSAVTPGQANRLLACFQQALGHDLSNKLVALHGLSRLLEQDLAGKLDDETQACVERLGGLSRQIQEYVGALAEVVRGCRRTGDSRPVSPAELWAEVRAEVLWTSPGRPLLFDCSPTLPGAVLPRESLRRVLLELVRDGLRRCPASQPLQLHLHGLAGENWLEVRDDGPAPARPEQLFEPNTNCLEGAGAGLGLFLASLLVEGWGGTLRLMLSAESGCCFRLDLPA